MPLIKYPNWKENFKLGNWRVWNEKEAQERDEIEIKAKKKSRKIGVKG